MEKRREMRSRKRLICALLVGTRRHTGVVLDLTEDGLYVQTTAKLMPGSALGVELKVPGRSEPLALRGRIARRVAVPLRLQGLSPGGVGVSIVSAPEDYHALVAGLRERT